ncbi:SAM-dependent methyltransferase [Drancourtella sp. An12]|uniref:BREX-1 system adenine-specific DNA-methyltransferase PglX n=1 Tax=Drancourtella sp. An12 TaxID=1965548 RepID=UPI000B386C23|nr:BREX-1 system adenine-specific DNA-methyltransferase PglX [Drancourtella sp. An12]OUQ45274.1 SAM-dependent methyltransferase [Drancourtella sp. An12]
MDKNAIKKYAVWARKELIARVTQKAEQYEITEKKTTPADADSIGGRVLTAAEKKQRQALIAKINQDGFEQVMEEVAYTWFNRFTALRFMEVNNYLPSHTRIFTNEKGEFKPQILVDAIQLDLEGLNMDKVFELKDANKTEELYKYLLITQCNSLSGILPRMFQKIEDYTELLLPDYLLREGSIIDKMIDMVPEDNFDIRSENGQVEILGWLYQYYISEKHDEVVNISNKEPVKKEDIPAATQLFTTDWVVRYIIDNSIGKYWIERKPNSTLREQLEYFVAPKNGEISYIEDNITPQEMTIFDPCMGSGHFLVYAFDVLMKIYTEYGYSERKATVEIIEHNIFGVDIDVRAAQLAYFAIMMKARQYDRRFFSRGVQPHVYAIVESGHTDKDGKKHKNYDEYALEYFCNGDVKLKTAMDTIIRELHDAKEYGSILTVTQQSWSALYDRFAEITEDINMSRDIVLKELLPLVEVAQTLSTKYTVVATNPPYLNKYNSKLKDYLTDNYKDYSGDLFSVFMFRNFEFCKKSGYLGFMTPFVWMYIKTYEKLRKHIIENKGISTLIQMEYSAFEEATVPICAFVLTNDKSRKVGQYFDLSKFVGGMNIQKEKVLDAIHHPECTYFHDFDQDNYKRIDGSPIAFMTSEKLLRIFETADPLKRIAEPKVGLQTGNNDDFLRLWYEVDKKNIGFGMKTLDDAQKCGKKWFPYNKGGDFKRWYGNRNYVVNWENDGYAIKHCFNSEGKLRSRPQNQAYYLKPCITWSDITSAQFSGRYCEGGFLFDVKGSSGFPKVDELLYVLGFLNSKISQKCIKILNPTITTQVGDMARIPVYFEKEKKEKIDLLVDDSVKSVRTDWDSFETSWDFQKHPLLRKVSTIAEAFDKWQAECDNRFNQLKANEEELNRIFIDIYGLQDELTPEVEDKDVTVRKADLGRDIRSFISYAVGCMFGRYSLDEPGLILTGQRFSEHFYEASAPQAGTGYVGAPGPYMPIGEFYYKKENGIAKCTYSPDKDNIIPICDDEYFDDDIVGRFVGFVKTVYGEDTLDENLKFIADALGGKGQPKDVIRNYFLNDFYKDHCKIYQKRPIYWLFDSGKKNGFKALIYMHRYQPDTIARIRTDYVHEQQSRYRTAMADLEKRIDNAAASERVKLNKELNKLQAQAEEIRVYEEKIHHLADQMISIDLDDGVKHNYALFQDVLAKIK